VGLFDGCPPLRPTVRTERDSIYEVELERGKTRGSNVVGASSPESLARSRCPKKPSLAGSTLQGISIDVLSRPDLGIARLLPDMPDFWCALLWCSQPGVRENADCCSRRPTGIASAPSCPPARPRDDIFQCAAYCLLCLCDACWDHETHTSHGSNCPPRLARQLFFECTYTKVFRVSARKVLSF
jgi:hypothetical protein